jgi:anti-sigma factor RsiW
MNETHPSIEQIVEYLHGELSPAQDAAMHVHLAACRSCDERRAEEAAIAEALRAHARATERDLPPRVVANIREAIEHPAPSAWDRLGVLLRPVFVLPATAAIVAALYFGLSAWHGTPGPTVIDAQSYVENHAAMAGRVPFAEDAPFPATLTSNDETP